MMRVTAMHENPPGPYAAAMTAVAALFKDLPEPFEEGVLLMLEEDIDFLSVLMMEMNILEKGLGWAPSAASERVAEIRRRLMDAVRAKMDILVALSSAAS